MNNYQSSQTIADYMTPTAERIARFEAQLARYQPGTSVHYSTIERFGGCRGGYATVLQAPKVSAKTGRVTVKVGLQGKNQNGPCLSEKVVALHTLTVVQPC